MTKRQNVTGVTRSPLNAARWCLDLACGHQSWVTSDRRPTAKTAVCHIEEGTMGGSPAERDTRTGTIEQGPEVTRRAAKRARRPKVGRPPAGPARLIAKIRPLFTDAELRAIDALVKRENAERIVHHTPATWIRELVLAELTRAKKRGTR